MCQPAAHVQYDDCCEGSRCAFSHNTQMYTCEEIKVGHSHPSLSYAPSARAHVCMCACVYLCMCLCFFVCAFIGGCGVVWISVCVDERVHVCVRPRARVCMCGLPNGGH